MLSQSYVSSVRRGVGRVGVTLNAALDMGAGEDFTGRLLKFEDDAKRALGEYDTFVLLCS